jgi:Peptidase family M23
MNKYLFALILLCPLGLAGQRIGRTLARNLQKGRVKEDTSYVYWLPYRHGGKHLMTQGYFSKFSHGRDIAIDFKMRKGTAVCAARGGVVEDLYEKSSVGGLKEEYLDDGNYLIIRHADGSKAMYWHLKKDGILVNRGDTVKQGQQVALSGNTGYSAFPHLHFEVWGFKGGYYQQLPTRFMTKRGPRYLRQLRYYKAVHK